MDSMLERKDLQYEDNLQVEMLGEAELRTQLYNTRELFEAARSIILESKDGIFITDGNGRVLLANTAYEVIAGVKLDEIIGKQMEELEGWTISESATLKVLKRKKAVTVYQEYLRTKRHAYITSTPVFGHDGAISMVVSNNRDFQEIAHLSQEWKRGGWGANTCREKVEALADAHLVSGKMIAEDARSYEVLYQASKVARVESTVLIYGETGTGKEEIAKFIHRNSNRSGKPLISINCGAISANLMQSELFGYEKGAFTGAEKVGHLGYFEAADQGTIFLDEVGEMSLELQVQLLRVIQEGTIMRVGGTRAIPVDVRVIAATNQNLQQMVEEKRFRADLYYRLNVISLYVPPLRQRRNDIPALVDYFLTQYTQRFHVERVLTPAAMQLLEDYAWPGNVRELKNTMEQLALMADARMITPEELLERYARLGEENQGRRSVGLKELLERTEYQQIKESYERTGSLAESAQDLQINLKTLYRRKKYLEERYASLRNS